MNRNTIPLLSTNDLTKYYGSVRVLNKCSLDVKQGEIHALLGANGAGKSTLVRIIAGLTLASEGEMQLEGNPYQPREKQDAEHDGVQIVQQELNLIPTLTVAENLYLSRLPSRLGWIRPQKLRANARDALDRFGLSHVKTDCKVGTLGVGTQQMIEIAAALDRKCKLLILDEPTAALSAGETSVLFQWLRRMREQGTGIVYISHRLSEVQELSDRISILRDGQLVGTFESKQMDTTEMISQMTGDVDEKKSSFTNKPVHRKPLPGLRVEGLSNGIVNNVSLSVSKGERVGIAGLVGSGRTELVRSIFGADVAHQGYVYVDDDDSPRRFDHPQQAVRAGIALVTEDRKDNGLLLEQSIRTNVSLCSLWKRFSRGGLIRRRAESDTANRMCRQLDVRCQSVEQSVGTLSGGNQQKVAIAKWLVRDASVFLFDEPTRGIDVPARRKIHDLIGSLAKTGRAIVVVSSDIEELMENCDRIVVMSNGKLVESFHRPDFSMDAIMEAAFSGYVSAQETASH